MGNMSYCRFQNTLKDLRDCKDALEEMTNEGKTLSSSELDAAQELVDLCQEIVNLIGEAPEAETGLSLSDILFDIQTKNKETEDDND